MVFEKPKVENWKGDDGVTGPSMHKKRNKNKHSLAIYSETKESEATHWMFRFVQMLLHLSLWLKRKT